jgi:hypothetical protein
MQHSPVKPSPIGTPLTQRAAAERRVASSRPIDDGKPRYTGISLTRVVALLALTCFVLGFLVFPLFLVGLALTALAVLMSFKSKAYRS